MFSRLESAGEQPTPVASRIEAKRTTFHDKILTACTVTGDVAEAIGETIGATAKIAYKGARGVMHGLAT